MSKPWPYIIYPLDSSLFTQYQWEGSTVFLMFGFPLRSVCLYGHKKVLQEYAVGYCHGKDLIYRRKEKHVAVMFEKDSVRWWTHLRNEEFENIFSIEER